VLFQIPVPGNPDCVDGPTMPECFNAVHDLGALDIARGRDHGMPLYNDLRRAYGLAPKATFTAITGEATSSLGGRSINDPHILDFVQLSDIDGNPVAADSPEAETSVTKAVRRTTTAARLRAIYGSPDNVDAFVGMMAEQHVAGSEMGELQQAIWKKQFEALRNGDRFFFGNNQGLNTIQGLFGVDFHTTLADVIARSSAVPRADLEDNVFFFPREG